MSSFFSQAGQIHVCILIVFLAFKQNFMFFNWKLNLKGLPSLGSLEDSVMIG